MKPYNGIILVTGASGSIGSVVMRRMAGRFEGIVGFDREAPKLPSPGCLYVPVDVTSDESVREGLRIVREHHGTQVASVIHLAAYYDFLGEPTTKYDEITVGGTRRLLRGLLDGGFQVAQFVFSSTMLVHGPVEPGQFITEDSALAPTWAYPESKVQTEALIRTERGDMPVAAHSDNLFGALVVTVAIIAMADVGRATRYLNVLFGAWVVIAPWLMTGATMGARMNDAIAGGLIVLLSYRRGPVSERYGSYARFIR